ncbi:carbon-nitrogen hydrolase [Nitratiruptor tergarcus]|uniref:N-carbamoylputrescine amidase n=1 Tax=Nitratiruptor tergarcus DSM 16512 TaxID=1069081 RepID=A0A1W1WSJ3_9BACT|nr:carbon-nitrogen hydrolase [Nitratiruptor tergarcus]SMC09010.1 N-carbamoylputrescine amidase [Nitratiruptor tergarcus DSM 16512]
MKVALIQQCFHKTKEDTIKKSLELIDTVSDAELVVLQELHQGPYFCQSEDTQNFALAEEFAADVEFWRWVSEEKSIVLVTSLFEKRAPGLYHNTAVVFDKGKIAGIYRKMHIPDDPGFYEKFYFTPGDLGFEPIDTSVGRLGVLVCWDQWYPEAARIMALKGAEILIYPTAIGWFDEDSEDEKNRQLDAWITIQRSHAIANGLPLISVNRVGFEEDLSGCLKGIRFWGNSFVCGPQGEIIIQGDNKSEQALICEIDINRTKEVRDIWPFLRDRRIEAYECLLQRFCQRSSIENKSNKRK